jgi:hypothetical protein
MWFKKKNIETKSSNYPCSINWSQTTISDLISLEFQNIVEITGVLYRIAPTSAIVRISGDEFGDRIYTTGPQIAGINVLSAGATLGTPTVNYVNNFIEISSTLTAFFFFNNPWRTRVVNLQGSAIGSYVIGFNYTVY